VESALGGEEEREVQACFFFFFFVFFFDFDLFDNIGGRVVFVGEVGFGGIFFVSVGEFGGRVLGGECLRTSILDGLEMDNN